MNKMNKKALYFFPMLNIPYYKVPGILDCYISTVDTTISIDVRTTIDHKYLELNYPVVFKHHLYDTVSYNINDKELITFDFNQPDQYTQDYNNVYIGNYGELSALYKRQIIKIFPQMKEDLS